MSEYKKEVISARISIDIIEQLKRRAEDEGVTLSDVISSIISDRCVRKLGTYQIDLRDTKITTLAGIVELQEKLNKSLTEVLDFVFDNVINQAGEVEEKYLELAKKIKDGDNKNN